MPNVDWFGAENNQIESLEPLRTLTKLTFLQLKNNKIKELEPISALQVLGSLYLSNNYVDDISPLYDIISMSYLEMADNCVPKEQFSTLKEKNPDIVIIGVDLDNYVIPEKCQ